MAELEQIRQRISRLRHEGTPSALREIRELAIRHFDFALSVALEKKPEQKQPHTIADNYRAGFTDGPCPYCDEQEAQLAQSSAALAKTEARVKELEGKLPKTKDGVVIGIKSKIWFGGGEVKVAGIMDLAGVGFCSVYGTQEWLTHWEECDKCYSAREAAEAAQEVQK